MYRHYALIPIFSLLILIPKFAANDTFQSVIIVDFMRADKLLSTGKHMHICMYACMSQKTCEATLR